MYRAPDNENRVKSIKSKFESIQNNVNKSPEKKTVQSGNRCNVNGVASANLRDRLDRNQCGLSSALNKNKTEAPSHDVFSFSRPTTLDIKRNLTRQLSDPSKCNIKRTPAFRVDRSSDKAIVFQRNALENRSHRLENKVKQYTCVVKSSIDKKDTRISIERSKNLLCKTDLNGIGEPLKSIDTNSGKISVSSIKTSGNDTSKGKLDSSCFSNTNKRKSLSPSTKPVLIKSKSSIDFAHLRSKFDNPNLNMKENCAQKTINAVANESQRNVSCVVDTKPTDLSLLYTEPIPRALRVKRCDREPPSSPENNVIQEDKESDNENSNDEIHNCSTLKLGEPVKTICDITSEIVDSNKDIRLTDTLQRALSKPLPCGPAPQKPPRTFAHASNCSPHDSSADNFEKNTSFLHSPRENTKKLEFKLKLPSGRCKGKGDPNYMLNKLENALRNNKLRSKKHLKTDISTTSGEDSDDSVLFKSKSKRDLPEIPVTNLTKTNSLDNLFSNCFHGLTCSGSPYAKITEPNSSFFINCKKEEHVYAEPISSLLSKQALDTSDVLQRNQLYYLSSPVECCKEVAPCVSARSENMENNIEEKDSKIAKDILLDGKASLSENSSLSSFTSDFDSAASTPHEENKPIEQQNKIKHLIQNFESKQDPHVPESITPVDSSARIEELKNSLRTTLDRCFTSQDMNLKKSTSESEKSETLSSDQKSKTVDEMVNKFQTYVKMIRSYSRTRIKKDNRLFHCCFIVGWVKKTAQIKYKFPYNAKIPHRIEDLCYPEASTGPLDRSNNAQCYSLVITNDKGERTFGYCRRVLPEGSKDCLPLAYCILSKIRAPRFYKRVLIELESRHGLPDRQRDELISEFYYNKFPRPGESVKINLTNIICGLDSIKGKKKNYDTLSTSLGKDECVNDSLDLTTYVMVNSTGEYGTLNKVVRKHVKDYDRLYVNLSDYSTACNSPRLIAEKNGSTELIITLHSDTRYEDADLKPLHKLPTDILLKIFASLLLERKVVLVSCVISKLSCCVEALQSILYPFSWPHTYIPILPQSLWDIVESPTPVLCGVLSVAVVNEFKIEHGIVVDLDEGNILIEEGDEDKILCTSMTKAWYRGLSLVNSVSPEEYVYSVYLSDAYLMVFIACFKDYKTYIVDGKFQKEAFLRSKSRGKRRFLKWFTETTMFMIFLDSILSDPKSFSLFDQKIQMYGSEESDIIVGKLLEWKR